MALDPADLAGIEMWTGEIDAEDYSSVEIRLERLGFPRVVALEILSIRMSGFLSEPMRMRLDGDVTWQTDRNVEALQARISQLAELCSAEAGLNAAAKAVVSDAVALAESGKTVRGVNYTFLHNRSGH